MRSIRHDWSTSEAARKWTADRARYGKRPLLRDLSAWAVIVYRFGQFVDERSESSPRKKLLLGVYYALHRLIEVFLLITLPKEATFGEGLRIYHLGPVVVHPEIAAGKYCTLRHGVTLGERKVGGGVPKLGDNVEIGAYAQVLGPIVVGDATRIGANALLLSNTPSNSTVTAPEAVISIRPLGGAVASPIEPLGSSE